MCPHPLTLALKPQRWRKGFLLNHSNVNYFITINLRISFYLVC